MKIIQATLDHLDQITPLFDAYRQFYEESTDLEGARDFIENNLLNNNSTIFLALDDDNNALSFMQLYPTWESVSMTKRWVLYDLYVTSDARGAGVGRAMMVEAQQLAKATGAKYVMLETATDNTTAQALYEDVGYVRDTDFYTYILEV